MRQPQRDRRLQSFTPDEVVGDPERFEEVHELRVSIARLAFSRSFLGQL